MQCMWRGLGLLSPCSLKSRFNITRLCKVRGCLGSGFLHFCSLHTPFFANAEAWRVKRSRGEFGSGCCYAVGNVLVGADEMMDYWGQIYR